MDSPKPDRRHLAILAVILVVGLGLRSWQLGNYLANPLAEQVERTTSSDMYAFTALARKIAAGDVLCREGYHPYMDWMGPIAPLATFEQWWGGKEIYHQTPLYPYLLAISHALFGGNEALLLLQVLLSSAALWLVFDLGRQLSGVRAGLIAAGIAAVFAPAIVFDSIQLRASFNSSATLLSIWLLMQLRQRPRIGWAVATGACLAASYLMRPTGLVLLCLGPLVLLLHGEARSSARRWLPALLAAALGVLAPFFVRNAIVGAPLFSLSTRGPETVLQANTKGADPGFMSTMQPDDYRALMDAGHGSLLRALGTAIDSWPEPSFSWWLWHQWQKLLCVFGDYEYANNINFYWFRRFTPVLEFLPTFGWLVGLGLVGMVLLARGGRQRGALWIPLLALGALWLGCVVGFVLARYRMPIGILLTLPAGVTLSLLVDWLRARRWTAAAVTAGCSVLLSVLSFQVVPGRTIAYTDGFAIQPPLERQLFLELQRRRPQEPTQAAQFLHLRGQTEAGSELLSDYAEELFRFTKGPIAQRLVRSPGVLYLLLVYAHEYMNSIAATFHGLGKVQLRNAAHARGLEFKRRADALRGN